MSQESGHLQNNFLGRHDRLLGGVGVGIRNGGIQAYVLAAPNICDSLAATSHLEDFISYSSSHHAIV